MADNFYSKYSANEPATSVSSVNGLSGALTLAAGSGITITPSGNTLTIASTVSSGANTALSNLTSPTAINQHLLAGTNATFNLGSATKFWNEGWIIDLKSSTINDVDNQPFIDTGTRTIVTAGGLDIATFASAKQTISGDGVNPGRLQLNKSTNAFSTLIQPNSSISSNTLFQLPPDNGSAGYVLSTDGSGVTSWTADSTGANVALSNLSSTAINQSLVPATPGGISLGSPSSHFGNLFVSDIIADAADLTLSTNFPGGSIIGYSPIGKLVMTSDPGQTTSLTLYYADQVSFIQLLAPSSGSGLTLILPNADGNSGDVLTTDGAGNLSFAPVSGDISFEQAFTNGDTINSSSEVLVLTPPETDPGVIDTATITTTSGGTVGASTFWDIQSTDIGPTGFYAWIWYKVNGSGSDPMPASPSGQLIRISIEVDIASTDSAIVVAAKTYAAITAMATEIAPYFTVTNPSGTDTFTVSGAFPGGFFGQDGSSPTGFTITDPGSGVNPTYSSVSTDLVDSIQPGTTPGQKLTIMFLPPSTSGNSINAVNGSGATLTIYDGASAVFGTTWSGTDTKVLNTYQNIDFIWTGNIWEFRNKSA